MKGGFIWLEGGGRIHRISELQRFIIALGLEDGISLDLAQNDAMQWLMDWMADPLYNKNWFEFNQFVLN